jgi:REP element-mobilizing transposase RayT
MALTLRKDIRLSRDEYIGKRIYFLTICVEDRHPIFREAGRAKIGLEELSKVADRLKVLVHAYCIMPDHVHLLAEGITAEADVVKFVAQWKQGTGFALRRELPRRFWQKGFYDHVLRRPEDSDAVAWYIWMNPVRKGLAASAGEYRFSGSFTVPWPPGAVPNQAWTPPWKTKT